MAEVKYEKPMLSTCYNEHELLIQNPVHGICTKQANSKASTHMIILK